MSSTSFGHAGTDRPRLSTKIGRCSASDRSQTSRASVPGPPEAPGLFGSGTVPTIARLREGSEIVAAFDADEAGRLLVDMLRLAVAGVATIAAIAPSR
jgi:hypothetical protein